MDASGLISTAVEMSPSNIRHNFPSSRSSQAAKSCEYFVLVVCAVAYGVGGGWEKVKSVERRDKAEIFVVQLLLFFRGLSCMAQNFMFSHEANMNFHIERANRAIMVEAPLADSHGVNRVIR